MHLIDLWYQGARHGGTGHLGFARDDGRARWTFLPGDEAGEEVLRLVAVVCGGPTSLLEGAFACERLVHARTGCVRVEALLQLHAPRDTPEPGLVGLGRMVAGDGSVCRLAKGQRLGRLPDSVRWLRGLPQAVAGIRPCLHLAYGTAFRLRRGPLERDFEDPRFRRHRVGSLFGPGSLTAPSAFLDRLDYRCRKGRGPALALREDLEAQLAAHLGLGLGALRRVRSWGTASPSERAGLLLLDAVRHLVDASPHDGRPLERAGVLSLYRPDSWADRGTLERLLGLLDALLPQMQFLVALDRRSPRGALARLASQRLATVVRPPGPATQRPRLRPGTVALVQVDGRLPNLALMKLAGHFREAGRRVHLFRPGEVVPRHLDEVYASAILHLPPTARRLEALRARHGPALTVGGTAVDLSLRLPAQIEARPADYTLYPELAGVALGFLTRGCPGRCAFCVVPAKEGPVRRVADLESLTEGGRRRRLILLDDNLLAHPDAEELLAEMIDRRLEVNFNQTLDLLRVSPAGAGLLRQVAARNVRFTRPCWHFSLNDARRLGAVARAYALFGFRSTDHVEFVCMYGHDTTLAEDVERFRFLRGLPGAYVFMQRYAPPLQARPVRPRAFFDPRATALLDELVGICFTENMKSMEQYYRWVSEAYYLEFGRLHRGLVDTLFRYNRRDQKGLYLAAHPMASGGRRG